MPVAGTSALFKPLQVGSIELPHRVVMAPLTRMRATPDGVPGPHASQYYAQRASAALIVTEATQVSAQGVGYPGTPGIYTPEQVAGWRRVTDAVHAEGGRIVLQLWHVGRVSHPTWQPDNSKPVGPSEIAAEGGTFDPNWEPVAFEAPRALDIEEIPGVVDQFRRGALNAYEAGFDGVEVHGGNGYLLDQFLQSGSNCRSDAYGGSPENRSRLLTEVVNAVCEIWDAQRVGVRLSPSGTLYGIRDDDPFALFSHVISQLDALSIGYLHLVEPRASEVGLSDDENATAPASAAQYRKFFSGPLIAAGGFNADSAAELVEAGAADAIAFGRHFIANPDLPTRLRDGAALNPYDRSTFYGGDATGYTDYPAL